LHHLPPLYGTVTSLHTELGHPLDLAEVKKIVARES